MTEKTLNLDKNLPNDLKEIIKQVFELALDSDNSIETSAIEEVLDNDDNLDIMNVLVELISKILAENGIKVINDNEEDEDESEAEEDEGDE